MTGKTAHWHPGSWRTKRAAHQPEYVDGAALAAALDQLGRLPPLVTSWEVDKLRSHLAAAARGERFLLQGGDCAESFDACTSEAITGKLKILLQMSLVLSHGLHRRVIRVGRFAGQYAKPRSASTEERDGMTLPSYFGDLVNRAEFTEDARRPDPERMLRAYERSALTLNHIRALAAGGFADLHHPEYWELDFVRASNRGVAYQRIVEDIAHALRLFETLTESSPEELTRVDFFSSHEALALFYEEALTKRVPHQSGWYNLSTHFPWIGMRTAAIDGAHVEYFRGIRNPIAIKIGPAMTPEHLTELIGILDPDREPGRLTLVHRMGASKVEALLPPLIDAARRTGRTLLFCSDPMHGNTISTDTGFKTRRFEDIRLELERSIAVHREGGTHLGGIHCELTSEPVTECVGGASNVTEADLARAYESQVDPRLNYEQAMELALWLADHVAAVSD